MLADLMVMPTDGTGGLLGGVGPPATRNVEHVVLSDTGHEALARLVHGVAQDHEARDGRCLKGVKPVLGLSVVSLARLERYTGPGTQAHDATSCSPARASRVRAFSMWWL